MRLTKFNAITVLIIILVFLTMIGRLFSICVLSNYTWILIFPLFAYLYYGMTENVNHFFGSFLVGFAVSELLNIVFYDNGFLGGYLANLFVIVSFVSLVVYLVKDFDFKMMIKNFKIHLVVLLLFNIYINYVLNNMILEDETFVFNAIEFSFEVIYNISILLVLSMSLLHFLFLQSRIGLLLFLASVCIVFSEMSKIAYVYISSVQLLKIIYSVFMGAGFYFLYSYIKIKHFSSPTHLELEGKQDLKKVFSEYLLDLLKKD